MIDPIEGKYCKEICAKLAKQWAWAIYDYYAFSAKADNARFDINANYQRLEYDEAQALAKAKSKLAEANSLRDQLNNNKCEKGCNP